MEHHPPASGKPVPGHAVHERRTTPLTLLAAGALIALVAACSTPRSDFAPETRSYTTTQVVEIARDANVSAFEDLPVSEAPRLRRSFLGRLRASDDPGPEFASLYTRTFPLPGRSVPVLVQAADVDGHAAWVIVEVFGPEGGNLRSVRYWILDRESGRVLSSAFFR
jgi:hypothetical protein